nr:dCTP deaminase [Motilibacter aurantiacus]
MSDGTIRRLLAEGRLVIDPIDPAQVQPASVDVRLGAEFLVFRNHTAEVIDPYEKRDDLMEKVRVPEGQPFVLHPGEFVLGTTLEAIGLPDDLVARVEGKSSLGRLGLLIHATAGFVDPGWTRGQITLELSNVATLPIKLWPGMRIGQLSFHCLDAPAERPYGHPDLGSKYVGQRGPVASQYQQNRHGAGQPEG